MNGPTGRFEVSGVVPGAYLLRAVQRSGQNELRAETPIQVTADFTLAATPGATLTVTPRGTSGPVRVDLTFAGIEGARTFANVVTAYAPRSAEIRGLGAGRYTIRARTTQSERTRFGLVQAELGQTDSRIDVTLTDPPAVSGRLWIEDTREIPEGFYVELENEVEGIHTRRPVARDGSTGLSSVLRAN